MKKRIKITKAPLKKAKTGTHIGLENYFKSSMQKDPSLNQFGEEPVSIRKTITDTKGTPNIEAEGGEFIAQPGQAGMIDTFKIKGKPHSRGGVKLAAEPGAFIYSQYKKMAIKNPEILKFFGLNPRKKGYTPAEIAMRFDNSKYSEVLLNPDTDKLEKETAEKMMQKNNLMLSYLALYVESEKGFQEGVPEIGNIALEKLGIDPNQILPQQQQEQEQMMAADQSMAKLGNFIKSYKTGGMYRRMYQGGGPIPMQQGSAPGEEVMMMIQQMMEQGAQPQDVIMELLNQGVEPQTIQEAFLAMGMPPEQVVPMIEEVIAMAQGQMQQGPSPEEAAMMAQQGMAPEAQALMQEPPMARLGRFLQRAQTSKSLQKRSVYLNPETGKYEITDSGTGETRIVNPVYAPEGYGEEGPFNPYNLPLHVIDEEIMSPYMKDGQIVTGTPYERKYSGSTYRSGGSYPMYQASGQFMPYMPDFSTGNRVGADSIPMAQYSLNVPRRVNRIERRRMRRNPDAYPELTSGGREVIFPNRGRQQTQSNPGIMMIDGVYYVYNPTVGQLVPLDPNAFNQMQSTISQGGKISSRPTAKKNVPDGRIITEDDYNSGDPKKVKVGDYVEIDGQYWKVTRVPVKSPIEQRDYQGSDTWRVDREDLDPTKLKNTYQYLEDVFKDPDVKKAFAKRVRAAAREKDTYERKVEEGQPRKWSKYWTDAGKKASLLNKIDNMTDDQIVDLHLKMQKRNYKVRALNVEDEHFDDGDGIINWNSLTQEEQDYYKSLGVDQGDHISKVFDAIGEPVGGWGSEEVALEQLTHWGYKKLVEDKYNGTLSPEVNEKIVYLDQPDEGHADEPFGKISPVDGYYTDTSAFEKDYIDSGKGQGDKELWQDPYDPEIPYAKPHTPWEFYLQDKINIGTDLANWLSAKEYGPWSKPVRFGRPEVVLRSPMTDLNMNLAQQKIAANALGAYGQGMQGLGYTLSDIAGRGLEGSAKILADVANYNIPVINQYYDKVFDAETKEDLYNAERLGKDYAGWVTMRQGADNFNRAMRRQLGTDLMGAVTNRAKAYSLSSAYPNMNIYPSIGGPAVFSGGTPLTGEDSGMGGGASSAEIYQAYLKQYPQEAATLEGRKRLADMARTDAARMNGTSRNSRAQALQEYNQLMMPFAMPAQNVYGG